jgi:hypothetical protein
MQLLQIEEEMELQREIERAQVREGERARDRMEWDEDLV